MQSFQFRQVQNFVICKELKLGFSIGLLRSYFITFLNKGLKENPITVSIR